MTPFSLLISLAGLSHRAAESFLGVSLDSVRGWINGRRTPPQRVLDMLVALIAAQERAADEALHLIREKKTEVEAGGKHLAGVPLGYPADDHEAAALGMPCVGAWQAMAARVVAGSAVPVTLVPRGSTVATAGAAEAHEK